MRKTCLPLAASLRATPPHLPLSGAGGGYFGSVTLWGAIASMALGVGRARAPPPCLAAAGGEPGCAPVPDPTPGAPNQSKNDARRRCGSLSAGRRDPFDNIPWVSHSALLLAVAAACVCPAHGQQIVCFQVGRRLWSAQNPGASGCECCTWSAGCQGGAIQTYQRQAKGGNQRHAQTRPPPPQTRTHTTRKKTQHNTHTHTKGRHHHPVGHQHVLRPPHRQLHHGRRRRRRGLRRG